MHKRTRYSRRLLRPAWPALLVVGGFLVISGFQACKFAGHRLGDGLDLRQDGFGLDAGQSQLGLLAQPRQPGFGLGGACRLTFPGLFDRVCFDLPRLGPRGLERSGRFLLFFGNTTPRPGLGFEHLAQRAIGKGSPFFVHATTPVGSPMKLCARWAGTVLTWVNRKAARPTKCRAERYWR